MVDDLATGSRDRVPSGARFYPVDVRSPQIDEVFATERPEVVSHHAAQVSVRHSPTARLGRARRASLRVAD